MSKDGSKVLAKSANGQGPIEAHWHGRPARLNSQLEQKPKKKPEKKPKREAFGRAVTMHGLVVYTGLSRRQLYRVMAEGHLRPYRPPGIQKHMFDLAEVDDWLEAGRAASAERADLDTRIDGGSASA